MAGLIRGRSAALCSRICLNSRILTASLASSASAGDDVEAKTHTGQLFQTDDYRRARFVGKEKLINPNWAIDMVAEEPVVVCTKRVVSSCSGGALGHPKVYINLDPPEVHHCGYSGRKFVLKKYYDEKTMGPSITYDQYLVEIGKDE